MPVDGGAEGQGVCGSAFDGGDRVDSDDDGDVGRPCGDFGEGDGDEATVLIVVVHGPDLADMLVSVDGADSDGGFGVGLVGEDDGVDHVGVPVRSVMDVAGSATLTSPTLTGAEYEKAPHRFVSVRG